MGKRDKINHFLPLKQILLLIVTICASETVVMIFMYNLKQLSPLYTILLDTVILIVLIIPPAYLFLYKRSVQYVSENERIKEELIANEEKFRSLFHLASDAIFLHPVYEDGSFGKFIEVNDTAVKMLGFSREELLNMTPIDLVVKGTPIVDVSGRENITFETQHRTKDGRAIPVEISVTNFVFRGVNTSIGIVRDITERKKADKQISYLAFHDALTGLPNRARFMQLLEAATKDASRLGLKPCVMFLDLDGFKSINDKLGHQAGDEVLSIIAKRMNDCLNEEDTVARMGGDEFTFLFPNLNDKQTILIKANEIISQIQRPMLIKGNTLNVTASLGIAIFPENGNTANMLLKNADIAMYYAKEKGKNNYQFFNAYVTAI